MPSRTLRLGPMSPRGSRSMQQWITSSHAARWPRATPVTLPKGEPDLSLLYHGLERLTMSDIFRLDERVVLECAARHFKEQGAVRDAAD